MARASGNFNFIYATLTIISAILIAILVVSSISLSEQKSEQQERSNALTLAQQQATLASFNAYLDTNTTATTTASGTCTWEIIIYSQPLKGAPLSPTSVYFNVPYMVQTHSTLVTSPTQVVEDIAESITFTWPNVYLAGGSISGIAVAIGHFSAGPPPFGPTSYLPLWLDPVLGMAPTFPSDCGQFQSTCSIGAGPDRIIIEANWYRQGYIKPLYVYRTNDFFVNSVNTQGFIFDYFNLKQYTNSDFNQFPYFSLIKNSTSTFRLAQTILQPLV